MAYENLAGCYDQFTRDVDYVRWADYLERHFARSALPIHTVLDLACGTGSLTLELARRGYEMIGVDQSEEMLAQAAEKCRQASEIPPLFLHQSMDKLDLYGTIDACVCCLDSVNYVTSPQKLERAFQRVHTFLMPGGLFMFDVNTPDKLRALDGQVFLDESADAYCVWRADYSARSRVCTYGMDQLTREQEGRLRRAEELHEEYAYEPDELEALLIRAGFSRIKQYGERKLRAPKAGEGRIFFAARKES